MSAEAAILVVPLVLGAALTAQAPDLILHDAVVWTVDAATPRAEAVAIRDGRIAAVGDEADVLALRGPDTEVLDLDGAFVMPGFNDTHVHFASAARFLEFNVMTVTDAEEFAARVADATARVPAGEWILGGFWGAYDAWSLGSDGAEGGQREPFRPDLRSVAALTAEHPMFIRRYDGGEFAANRLAMESVGLDPDDPRVRGVEFERDGEGRPTGLFRGPGAERLFAARSIQRFSRERRVVQTRFALAEIARRGVTSVSDMSDDEQLDIYRELHERGELTVRVDFRYPLDRWKELGDRGVRAGAGDSWIRLGGLKGHIDGIMGTSTARFFEPYAHDAENRGRWRRLMVDDDGELVEGKLLGYLLDADRAGLQLTVHAIGDEANHLLLDYLDELNARNGARDRRFRLVHAQVMAPDDFARLGPLGVLAEVQPYHLSDDMRWMEERIGEYRCRGAYAFRSLLEGGARLCFGSDWPGTSAASYPIDPMLGLYAAVTRRTLRGTPAAGWFPEQRLTIEEAIEAYTLGGAYSTFEENRKGTITAGKLADLAVLSVDLNACEPSELLDASVRYTIVGGRVVYRAGSAR